MFLNSLDLPGQPEDSRIVVAMSGVDSSVVAGLLKRKGIMSLALHCSFMIMGLQRIG